MAVQRFITYFSAVAMGFVVIQHVPVQPPRAWVAWAVLWFFFVSGFWMANALLRAPGWVAWYQAMAKRVRSLLLPYYICNLIWFPIVLGFNWLGWRFLGVECKVDISLFSILRCLGFNPFYWPVLVPTWYLRALFVVSALVSAFWCLLRCCRLSTLVCTLLTALVGWMFWILELWGCLGEMPEGFWMFGVPLLGLACFATGGFMATCLKDLEVHSRGGRELAYTLDKAESSKNVSQDVIVTFIRHQMMPIYLLHVPVMLVFTWLARGTNSYEPLLSVGGDIAMWCFGIIGSMLLGYWLRRHFPRFTKIIFGGR